MAFIKHGSIFTITDSNQIKTASDWNDIVTKKSTAEGILIHNNSNVNTSNVVCQIDLDNYVYIHTTIMASVDLEKDSDYWITKSTEKYINSNGDAWQRDVLLKDYPTFIDNGVVYVEHDQNPERAKGKVLDAVARLMDDTILIDLLFCVDKIHTNLVHNILTGIANAVSMGCTTKYTICSICGNVAHDENEYCDHIKNYKNQMIKCADGIIRKCCELCFENSFYDCSVVSNPAFAGAVFRKLVASSQISSQLLANILCKKINSGEFENELLKVASFKTSSTEESTQKSYEVEDEFADIPYRDPHNIKKQFEEQQDVKIAKKASREKCADYGSLVIMKSKYNVPSIDRPANMLFNFLSKDTVGRLVGCEGDTCAVYFAKMGMIQNIPSKLLSKFSIEKKNDDNLVMKQAKKIDDNELTVNRQGIFKDIDCMFQILKVNDNDIEIRWLSGKKIGQKEEIIKKEFQEDNVQWLINKELAKFDAIWNGQFYQIISALWNEKHASVLDEFENHIDNVQNDITFNMPKSNGKYAKSFDVTTKFGKTIFKFATKIKDNNLQINVNSIDC
jgi:hypothetical protein